MRLHLIRARVLALLLFFTGAAPAAAQGFSLPPAPGPLALSAGALVLAAFFGVVLWGIRYGRRQSAAEIERAEFERLRASEILAAAPDGHFRWDLSGDGEATGAHCSRRLAVLLGLYGGTGASYAEILECFAGADAAVLEVAVGALRREGIAFEIELSLKDHRRRVLVIGNRAADQDGRLLADIMWMRDVTEGAAEMDRLGVESDSLAIERDRLRGLLDALPAPVWLRDGDLALVICNLAYARAVDAPSPADAVARAVELVPAPQAREARALAARARAANEPRSEQFRLVMMGERRLVEIIEAPLSAAGNQGLLTVGIAIDRTSEEDLQGQLERHISAQAEVLENIGTAIAIFAADARLTFFNTAYAMLWQLEPEWLSSQPSYGNVLDLLRERRRLPEVANFRAYKDEEMKLFVQLLEPREDLLHLPDERTLRRFVAPHPFGGLLFTYEDVSDALALERSLTTSLAVYRATLENLHEGVAVVSGDGRLRLSNPAFGRIWNLAGEYLAGGPHFTELIERHHAFFADSSEWPKQKSLLLALFGERTARSGRLARSDGTLLDYASVPLPDGAVLATWLDVTDRARAEQAQRERNEAVAAADRIKAEFIGNIGAELKAPLATILGLSRALADSGGPDAPHATVARGIEAAGRRLDQAVGDILDLAAIEAGQTSLSMDRVDVLALIGGVLEQAKGKHGDRRVEIDVDIAGAETEIRKPVVADEGRLRRVLAGLIAGALKATPDGEPLTVTLRREDMELAIVISGGGEVTEEQQKEFLFGAQARRLANEDDLGLALARRYAALHGGKVEAAGPGRVTLRLPFGE